MLAEIELSGTNYRWCCNQRRIRIGRDAGCDVCLQDETHSMVSREHATLLLRGETLQVTDNGSANGTFLNGVRVNASTLRSGDTVQLGADGPQLCVRLIEMEESDAGDDDGTVLAPNGSSCCQAADTSDAILASGAGKPLALNSGVGEGVDVKNIDTRVVLMGTTPVPADTAQNLLRAAQNDAAIPKSRAAGVRVMLPERPDARQQSVAGSHPVARLSGLGDERVIEKKLGGLRNLLAANLVLMVLLLLGILYQNKRINENRDAIEQLQKTHPQQSGK
ncbi:MAG: FHA domain-containing protein [Terriglobales bacterium]